MYSNIYNMNALFNWNTTINIKENDYNILIINFLYQINTIFECI